MKRNEVLQIRIDPALQAGLQRLRDERHLNISAWLRDLITAELDRAFPPPATGPPDVPQAPTGSWDEPIPGFRPKKLDDGSWGAMFKGDTSALPAEIGGTRITVQPRSGAPWTATVTEVVERSSRFVIVRDSGRPDHA